MIEETSARNPYPAPAWAKDLVIYAHGTGVLLDVISHGVVDESPIITEHPR